MDNLGLAKGLEGCKHWMAASTWMAAKVVKCLYALAIRYIPYDSVPNCRGQNLQSDCFVEPDLFATRKKYTCHRENHSCNHS